jgi:hypothetical protein
MGERHAPAQVKRCGFCGILALRGSAIVRCLASVGCVRFNTQFIVLLDDADVAGECTEVMSSAVKGTEGDGQAARARANGLHRHCVFNFVAATISIADCDQGIAA